MIKKISFLLIFSFFSFLSASEFTIAVIPDSQGYVYSKNQIEAGYRINFKDIYTRQIEYIVSNSITNGGKIVFASHVGDNVESRNRPEEWVVASNAIDLLDDVIPFSIVPGNHDYDVWTKDENTQKITINGLDNFVSYFGSDSSHFNNKEWYGGSYNGGANSYQFFYGDEIKFLHIGLEMEPSDDVIKWAQSVIDANPGIPTILTTHQYLTYSFDPKLPGFSSFHGGKWRDGYERNSSIELWEKLISKNKQIFLVLCGHNFNGDQGEGVRVDTNLNGFKVYSILSDYQGRREIYSFNQELKRDKKIKIRNCGDGWLRLLSFDLDKNQVHVQTYSTEMNKYEKDANSDFIIKFDWDWNERFSKKEF